MATPAKDSTAVEVVEARQHGVADSRLDRPLSVEDLVQQVALVQQVQKRVMKDGEHYGVIPGTTKPTLLKPGAEKLSLTFSLAPSFNITRRTLDRDHVEYEIVCRLTNKQSGAFIGEGVGLCTTMESRYRWRQAQRKCPSCGRESVIKGKEEYGGGWLCWKKKDGCGATFSENDRAILDQQVGRIENPDIADTYNTVLKIAKKRALVDAILTGTAASDIFTQDMEDLNGDAKDDKPAAPTRQPEQPAAADVVMSGDDRDEPVCGFGKNKGKAPSELADRSLEWYADTWEIRTHDAKGDPLNPSWIEKDMTFKAACKAELQRRRQLGNDLPPQASGPPHDEDDEIPF